jgi:hypothetical protein
MDDEIKIDTIEWLVPEYSHKERSPDWFWAIGIITVISCGVTLWLKSYIFSIFLAISGLCLIMFTLRHPQDVKYIVESKGLTMGKDLYPWKNIKSFNIKNNEDDDYAKLLIETNKHFLPIYTIPLEKEKVNEMKETLKKIIPRSEINESGSMLFAEKLGF